MEKIHVNTVIASSLSHVWDCFTNPMYVTGWNFASSEWYCPTAKNDLVIGGRFSYRMASIDGCMGFDFEGTFTEIQPVSLLQYRLDDDRMVDVLFEERPEGVLVSEAFDAELINSIDMQKAGWQAILDNFKAYCEKK